MRLMILELIFLKDSPAPPARARLHENGESVFCAMCAFNENPAGNKPGSGVQKHNWSYSKIQNQQNGHSNM